MSGGARKKYNSDPVSSGAIHTAPDTSIDKLTRRVRYALAFLSEPLVAESRFDGCYIITRKIA